MSQNKSQNSKTFDGKHLSFTKTGVMYKYAEPKSFQSSIGAAVGSKKFKNVSKALKHTAKELETL